MDVFLGVNAGPSHLLRNDGGVFTDVTGVAGTVGGTATWAAEWGDFDNDGWPDLFIADSEGADFLYKNLGNGVFSDVAEAKGVASIAEGTGANFADYDLDGDLDLYVANFNTANTLYNNLSGSAYTATGEAGLVSRTRAAAWADYDRDGDPDLYVSTEAANVLYRDDAAAKPWLAVDLLGRTSNRNGIGARITASANGKRQIRQVSAGFGFGCQEPLRTQFGLGAGAATVDTIIVDWPSHKRSLLTGVAINQTLLVDEAGAVDAPPAPPLDHLALAAPWPSPARSAVAFDVSVPAAAAATPVSLEILAANGRVVARVNEGVLGAGVHRLRWNLRDGGGARVGAGVYFAALRAGMESRRAKVVVLPE
jgi:ASPIC/UnbV protein/VCBS repeat protein/flagellar hook capping protein FlgD